MSSDSYDSVQTHNLGEAFHVNYIVNFDIHRLLITATDY